MEKSEWRKKEDGSFELVRPDDGIERLGEYREIIPGNEKQIPLKAIEILEEINKRRENVIWDSIVMVIHKPGIDKSSGMEYEFENWTVGFRWEERKKQ